MTEPQLHQCGTRPLAGDLFSGSTQEFNFSVGKPYAWCPRKSYFLIKARLTNLAKTAPLKPADLTAYADNFAGNLYENIYLATSAGAPISKIGQFSAQASALDVRLENTFSSLKTLGSNACGNEASLQKRILMCTKNSPPTPLIAAGAPSSAMASVTSSGAYDDRDVYRPYLGSATVPATLPANFAAATVFIAGATITGINTDFIAGMPLGIAPVGGPVLPGDLIVILGISYEVVTVPTLTTLTVSATPTAVLATPGTTDWFIVRAETLRAPQCSNEIEVMWRPPLGIMKYEGYLGAGNFQWVLSPNSNYELAAVESKNPVNAATTRPYKIEIQDVKFFWWSEMMDIAEGPRDLFLDEYAIEAKPYSNNLTFQIPSSSEAVSVFIQDTVAGSNPLVPPSMFKLRNNGDLGLTSILIEYGGMTKPLTPWESKFTPALTGAVNQVNQLQQRYYDSYHESGLDPEANGCETFPDWLKRGPFYHFSFKRDMTNNATSLQVALTFDGVVDISTTARVFCVAHKRSTCQMVIEDGRVTSVAVADR